MADYAITGKKGTGKSKLAVWLIRLYLTQKRRAATNLDIDLSKLMGKHSRATYVRIPDKPTVFDLLAVGHGNPESYDEDLNGIMVLDEMATWLNARSFQDQGRAAVLDYFAHGRKHGWDIHYLMQNIIQIDKQVRESFVEFVGRCIRFDKVKIPFIGHLLNTMFGGRVGYLPKFHMCSFRMGADPNGLMADRRYYRSDVEKAYDTRQVFRADYPHGAHSVLSPWHIEGRFLAPALPWWRRAHAFVFTLPAPRAPLPPKPRLVALLAALPASERIPHVHRLQRLGLL